VKATVALNTATPLSALHYVFESLGFALLITANLDFADQKPMKSAFGKIAKSGKNSVRSFQPK
jgi:pentose-5-phosphate-3-epimerase